MEYLMIRAWGKYMGSYAYYIRDQIATAKEDKAPTNAIYKKDDGTWATIEDVKGPTRATVENYAAAIQKRGNPAHPFQPPRTIM
jgi:hypothetical protein